MEISAEQDGDFGRVLQGGYSIQCTHQTDSDVSTKIDWSLIIMFGISFLDVDREYVYVIHSHHCLRSRQVGWC